MTSDRVTRGGLAGQAERHALAQRLPDLLMEASGHGPAPRPRQLTEADAARVLFSGTMASWSKMSLQ
jgi:hypothetical protein